MDSRPADETLLLAAAERDMGASARSTTATPAGSRSGSPDGGATTVRRRLPVGGRRLNGECGGGQRLGRVGQQRDRIAAPQAPADVEHDAGHQAVTRLPQIATNCGFACR